MEVQLLHGFGLSGGARLEMNGGSPFTVGDSHLHTAHLVLRAVKVTGILNMLEDGGYPVGSVYN